MASESRTITYRGGPAEAHMLVSMLRAEGVKVEWESPEERRDLASMAQDYVVQLLADGTIVAIGVAVAKFRKHARGRVEIEGARRTTRPDRVGSRAMTSFHGDLGRHPEGSAMEEHDRRLAEVERTHAGRPQPEVLAALEGAIRGMGLEPDRRGLTELAQRIAEGDTGAK